jgi:IclR family acetate operon transcriptional repressor
VRNPSEAGPPRRPGQSLQSVERAITLLQLLAAVGPARVTDLARELDVHKSTVSRLLSTLERRGLADRVGDGTTFILGSGVATLAANAARPRSLSEVSRPVLTELAAEQGESVSINVLTDECSVLTVEQTVGPSGVTGFNWLGQRSPAHATAAGKVLLAQLPLEKLEMLLPEELPTYTNRTPDRQTLLSDLETVRGQNFAVCRDELELGLSAVAAPIHDSSQPVAALSISGPTARIFGTTHDGMVEAVLEAASQIGARLGSLPNHGGRVGIPSGLQEPHDASA